jgi:hypothetical protein
MVLIIVETPRLAEAVLLPTQATVGLCFDHGPLTLAGGNAIVTGPAAAREGA